LQQWCEHAQAKNRLASLDHADELECERLLKSVMSDDPMQQIVNERFTQLECIGRGTYGFVYSAFDRQHRPGKVAIKILRPSKLVDGVSIERFQEEVTILERLRHSSILKFYSKGEIQQAPYMITEYADAGTLAMLMQDKEHGLAPKEVAWLVAQIADGLQEIHSNAVVHRDIKPSNILLRRAAGVDSLGCSVWPLLSDFGLSKYLIPKPTTPITLQGEVLGTLLYMSPEQIRGEPLKTQSDIFSLGVILYELLYGEHPFLAQSDYQTRNNIVTNTPLRLLKRDHRVPSVLAAIVSKCLQKDPMQRYPNASDLVGDLRSFLSGDPVSVAPPTTWQWLSRGVIAHPIATTILGTLFVSLFVTIALLSREWGVQRELAENLQELADGRAKISQLFLDSMRATNSGMNDTILAGRRVLPSELLATLEQQIPLLDRALRLDPDDRSLKSHLQVMLHYASIGYISEHQLEKSLDARKRSYELITELYNESPEENLVMARINGEYWMGFCLQGLGRTEESLEWFRKSIAHARELPESHPQYRNAAVTLCGLQLQGVLAMRSMVSAKEAETMFRETAEFCFAKFLTEEKRVDYFIYCLSALDDQCELLFEMKRIEEVRQACLKVDNLLDETGGEIVSDWNLQSVYMWNLFNRLVGYAKVGDTQQVRSIVERWQVFAEKFSNVAGANKELWYVQDVEMIRLVPVFFEWYVANGTSDDSPEGLFGKEQALRQAVRACLANEEVDVPKFVKKLGELGIDTERLEKLIEQESKQL
jgi:serine/threonine protein kinase